MKGLTTGLAIAGVGLLGVGAAMAVTNPGPADYDAYATQRLTQYLTENVCPKTPKILGIDLGEDCGKMLQQNQAQLREIISINTERQNFGIASVYKTTLSPGNLLPPGLTQLLPTEALPTYNFETFSVLGQHYIYRAERQ